MCLVAFSMVVSDAKDEEEKNTTQANVSSKDVCDDIVTKASATTGQAPSNSRWLYQLQNASIGDIKATQFDILTIDYSWDGGDDNRYSSSELQSLHTEGKMVLAYLSVGEAEDYRYYFASDWVTKDSSSGLNQPNASAPCWLGRNNPDWEGNYKVQYWSDAWQTIVIEYLDKIIDSGFDGVYLDIVDGYDYWGDYENGEGYSIDESVAAKWMITFVKRIAYHARVTRGENDFYIFPQNGESILTYDSDGSYLQTISGIGIEDLYYNETIIISDAETAFRIDFIDTITTDGKKVFVIDYVDDGSGYRDSNKTRIDDFRFKVLSKGYFPYVGIADRELDEINIIPGIQE